MIYASVELSFLSQTILDKLEDVFKDLSGDSGLAFQETPYNKSYSNYHLKTSFVENDSCVLKEKLQNWFLNARVIVKEYHASTYSIDGVLDHLNTYSWITGWSVIKENQNCNINDRIELKLEV